jgi:predicted nuclease of restriction endonuclease-like (RecB) superfamily
MTKITHESELDINYQNLIESVKKRITEAQYEALKKVNKELIQLYWDLGKLIVDKQSEHKWGKSIVEQLSKDLQAEFPGIKGFSIQNLWYMRQFYTEYKDSEKLQPLVGEISWSKNIAIMSKCKDEASRYFYMLMTKRFGWTKNVLINKIEAGEFQKYALNQTNFEANLPEPVQKQAKLAVKDDYTFDFLELSEEHSEHELELGLIRNIRKFLLEMGGHFCFIANQHRLEVSDQEFFIDLLLYHRQLKSLVAIELKIGDFKPEYAGKMSFYLSALNDKEKLEGENPAIGIIICKTKDRTIVEYALNDNNQPIGVGTYTLQHELPEALSKYLPSQEDLIKGLESFGEF